MSIEQNSSEYVHVKNEQPESFSKKMVSIDPISIRILVEKHQQEQLQLLTNIIDDPLTNTDTKLQCLESRVMINFDLKRWQEVIKDIDILELSINSRSLLCIKIKAQIQESCRRGRASIMQAINDRHVDDNDEIETLFFNISQRCVDELLEGQNTPKRRATAKSNTNERLHK